MAAGPHDRAADIIIPVHNHFACTRNLLQAVYRYTDFPFHLYLIDNNSTDETVELEKIYTRSITVVRNPQGQGWGASLNQGIRLGCSPQVIILSNHAGIYRGWLGRLVEFLESHPRIAAVGPLTSDPAVGQCVDRVRQGAVPQVPLFLSSDPDQRSQILSYHFDDTGILIESDLGFFCIGLKRRAIIEVGPFGETDGADEGARDYCRRLRQAGYVLGLSLGTYVLHPLCSTPGTGDRT
jgi:GT2 family glycosyltransferase